MIIETPAIVDGGFFNITDGVIDLVYRFVTMFAERAAFQVSPCQAKIAQGVKVVGVISLGSG
jgi:hypothetical protein